jgi:hypothetical protein
MMVIHDETLDNQRGRKPILSIELKQFKMEGQRIPLYPKY